ncbi:acetaldehyde dehydrogenase (acetylating) [Actinomycetospora straminea]|uniref:Acetaldehyde dehydrogenase n=1 Tax=Actinomycetospora straminea TaxID=663607 RepID=A0ABP9E8F6_9PSEU|nr:acetaldehyde dehydrogenase (acetylating) [Actinomycetospora straminea]MDD7932790.1 acetaldehyde dehydrogenase (acetylating) [Actinomycetospora straminea]
MTTTKVAIIGSGNIGSDLMLKIVRLSEKLEVAALVGIDPDSDGLARARRLGIAAVDTGAQGLVELEGFDDIDIVFDATSAKAHVANAELLHPHGKRLVDLTPAAIGPYVVPPVNLESLVDAGDVTDVNMVTCGGQATIPIVTAISSVAPVPYAEIVASIASKSAGPGTRANIDEFTETTAAAIEHVGGAERGKAIIVLNPADPPLIMRDTVLCLVGDATNPPDEQVLAAEITAAVEAMVKTVAEYVPGYRLKQAVQVRPVPDDQALHTLIGEHAASEHRPTHQVSVFLEVEGAAHYLPAYAGNLDIMTSAALRVGEELATRSAS